MGRIQVMSTALANEIAAGEVVVRPASVVKELLENSLDAGATHIQLTLAEGGIREIALQDDGMGMDEDDALLAFRRHATSKVFAKPDLDRIRTLGFRGEALASIAAVARVQLITRTANSDRAASIAIAGGDMGGMEPLQHVGAPIGTRIEVRDLFFNTPARLKYLRTVQTEQSKCVEVVQRAALSRPDVSFSLSTEHSSLFQTPGGGDVRAVLAALYSVGEAKQFLDIEDATPDYDVHGLIGRPTQGRSSRAYAHLFVNDRPVRNFAVHQAVIEGYRNRLMVGKQPMYAIYLGMDPRLVDVNVHPHKEEVRFSEERDVTQSILRAVGGALDKTLLAPTPKSRSQEVRIHGGVEESSTGKAYSTPLNLDWNKPSPLSPPSSPPKSTTKPRFVAPEQTASARETELIYGESTGTVQAPQLRKSNWTLRPIGQALGMYVLADDGESMYIIDQHAAHERILFEEFRNRLIAREVRAMPLLTPFTLSLGPSVFHRVMNCRNALLQVGLTFDEFGAHDIVVRTVPDIWEGLDMESLASDLCDELPEGADAVQRFFHQMHDMLAMRACKAAVKANWHLSPDEMEALCRALPQLDDPFHCPHGRPVFLRFTNQDLEKEFRRIV